MTFKHQKQRNNEETTKKVRKRTMIFSLKFFDEKTLNPL